MASASFPASTAGGPTATQRGLRVSGSPRLAAARARPASTHSPACLHEQLSIHSSVAQVSPGARRRRSVAQPVSRAHSSGDSRAERQSLSLGPQKRKRSLTGGGVLRRLLRSGVLGARAATTTTTGARPPHARAAARGQLRPRRQEHDYRPGRSADGSAGWRSTASEWRMALAGLCSAARW